MKKEVYDFYLTPKNMIYNEGEKILTIDANEKSSNIITSSIKT